MMGCTKDTPRCEDAKNYMRDLRPCCRSHLVTMFRDLQQMLDAAGITWWIDYGTLLGAVRNPMLGLPPGIIPHDKDGDACFLSQDVPKFRALAAHWDTANPTRRWATVEAPSGLLHVIEKLPRDKPRSPRETHDDYRERLKFTAGCSFKVLWSKKNRTNIDFFWHERRADGTMYRERYIGVDKYKGREFPESKLFPLVMLPWEGLMLPAPNDPEWFCEMRYGVGWRTPIRANNDKVPKNDDGSVKAGAAA